MARKKTCRLRRPASVGLRRPKELVEEPHYNPEVVEKVDSEIAVGMHVYDKLELEMSDVSKKLWDKRGKSGNVQIAKTNYGVRPLLPFFFGIKHDKYYERMVALLSRQSKSKYPDGDTAMLVASISYLEHLGHTDGKKIMDWWRKTKDGRAYFALEEEVKKEMVLNPFVFVQEGQ